MTPAWAEDTLATRMSPVETANSSILLQNNAYNRSERFTAQYFGVGIETVRGWRKRGTGPKFKKINGKLIRYSLNDLITWARLQPGSGGIPE